MVTDAEHSKLKRERRKAKGLIQLQKWVTPDEKEFLLIQLRLWRETHAKIFTDVKG